MYDLTVVSKDRVEFVRNKLKALIPGTILSFSPDNTMWYTQYLITRQGIPHEVDFRVDALFWAKNGEGNKIKLVASGYGLVDTEPGYRDGPIFVTGKELVFGADYWEITGFEAPYFSETKEIPERISRDKLFIEITKLVSQRATCSRKQVGAVATIEGRIIATGYNGVPSGQPHCMDTGPEIGSNGGCTKCIHAEANLISWSAREGIKLKGVTLYCTLSPCLDCSKLLINSGIKEVIYLEKYRDTSGVDLLNKAGIITYQYKEEKDD